MVKNIFLKLKIVVAMSTVCVASLLASMALSQISKADDSGTIDPCKLNDITSIQRPVYPEDPNSPTFPLAFRFIQDGDPTLPVIIFLPGGPGESSIKAGPSKHPGFRYIRTDPRGVGCNRGIGKDVNSLAFSTKHLASDVIAIINSLKLEKYILHGHSYGTVLATEVASRAGSGETLFPPTAVVLSGILGKSLDSDSVYAGSQEQWKLVKKDLPSKVVSLLSDNDTLPFGASADQWGRAIVAMMGTSASIFEIFDIRKTLSKLQSDNPTELAQLKSMVLSDFSVEPPEYTRVGRPIWCGEISQSDNTDLALINGALVGHRTPNYCKGYPITMRYDSKDWQVSAPIFYFQGEKDNLTTLEQGRYHFTNQRKSYRFFVTLPEDSHVFPMCPNNSDALWRSMAKQGEGFVTALNQCSGLPRLETSGPTQ